MVVPGVLFFIVFKYIPMIGSVIAFKDYNVFKGFLASDWVGFKHFRVLFKYQDFIRVFKNTLILGMLSTIILTPVPIILSLMLNEVRKTLVKRSIQTVIYIPHFFSWVIIAGITFDLLSLNGLFNQVRGWFDLEPILAMQKTEYFRPIYLITSVWKEAGFSTIIYLAAISAIDPSLYESAMIDGASRWKQMKHVTLPLMMPTIITLFLLGIGNFLDLGFDQIFNLLTPMTYSVGDVIDTYVYRTGILQAQYSFTTAVGLFQSVIGFIMVYTFNRIANKTSEGGLW